MILVVMIFNVWDDSFRPAESECVADCLLIRCFGTTLPTNGSDVVATPSFSSCFTMFQQSQQREEEEKKEMRRGTDIPVIT